VVGLVRELRTGAGDLRPIAVAGVPALVPALARELRRDGDASAVREGSPVGAAALVYLREGEPTEADLAVLRAASEAEIPIVAVTEGRRRSVPYVLATDIVPVKPGSGFDVPAIAKVLARRLGEGGTSLAARLPAIRKAVCRELIRSFSRTNGLVGAAVFVPGVDLPVLTMNQARLVLRIARAHGERVDASRLPELLAVVAGGAGLRTVAREALGAIPVAGWAIKGAIAYTGTRAIGEAALQYFEAGAPLGRLVPGPDA
jgi:uncharacterized protein (DUF697 family)